ncbi:MAG: hypothetical protein OJF49_004533 [Ktedonobacterales bacterium]|jgi:nucleotide-binding universal stress UspA family protein|nr:MAG: hypothetical protein OJF49_004533 [Ktedonobacterales bacterium]
MFTRIVVPLDGTRFAEAALAPARELARAFGSRILVVRAAPPIAPISSDIERDLEQVDAADAYLHDIVSHLRAANYNADMALYLAEPGMSIAGAALLDNADLIVMAAHLRWKDGATSRASTTEDVLARASVPLLVWRVGAAQESEGGPDVEERPPYFLNSAEPIVVALDGTPFAEQALPMAETLARTFGTYLLLVRAMRRGAEVTEGEVRQYLLRIKQQLAERGIQATTLTRPGDPLGVLEAAWREYDGSMIVMTTHGYADTRRRAFGSLATRMVTEIEAPVLIVRASGASAMPTDQASAWPGPDIPV